MEPIRRILVPVDGSDVSPWVVRRAGRLLDRRGVAVRLLSVVEAAEDLASELVYRQRHRPVEDLLAGLRGGLASRGVLAEAEVRFGDPAAEILREIEAGRHELVVMPTHGRRGLERMLFGSVAAKVLHASPVPLLLFRPLQRPDGSLSPAETAEPALCRRVLVPLDLSSASEEILPAAQSLAITMGSALYLFTAVEGGAGEAGRRLEATEYLARTARRLGAAGSFTGFRVETGAPVEKALEAAADLAVDAVAMTTHGRTGLARALYGSVAEALLARAGVPILLLRNAKLRSSMPDPAPPSRFVEVR